MVGADGFLCIGWFGFNVVSAQSLGVSGLVAVNSLMAMGGGILAIVCRQVDPGFVHNGALAGLVANRRAAAPVFSIGWRFVWQPARWPERCLSISSLRVGKMAIDDVLGGGPFRGLAG